MARFKGSCLFKDPQAYRGVFFRISVLRKLEIFMLGLFRHLQFTSFTSPVSKKSIGHS